MSGHTIRGVEHDRAVIRGAALSIIRRAIEVPELKYDDARKDWLAPPRLNSYQRLEPLGFGLNQDDWWAFDPHDCTPDLVWPLDVGVICEHAGDDGHLNFSRHYTVTPKQVRGYASKFGPFMVRSNHAMQDRGQLISSAGLWVWMGGQWVDAQKRTLWNGRDGNSAIPERLDGRTLKSDSLNVSMASSLALRHRYEWAVSLGLEHSPSIRFATDPTGIKEVFKVRDLPPGRDRREALLTWVTDHWRQDRHDPDTEVYVRKHLRGAVAFSWRGMNVEILPAPFDLERREKLASDRAAMKLAGSDRRPSFYTDKGESA